MTVRLVTGEREALTVADTALVQRQDQTYLYIVDSANQVRRQAVVTGARQAGRVEILEGLAEGQAVVVEGTLKVRDGIEVRLTEKTALQGDGGRPQNSGAQTPVNAGR
jgi:membrane fusion protein (multidrug efflux system)